MGFVEQPEAWSASDQDRQRRAAPLPGRQRPHPNMTQTTADPEALHRRIDRRTIGTSGPELDVVVYGQVVIQRRGMAQQSHAAPHQTTFAADAEVTPENMGDTVAQRRQATAQTQKCRLARPVRPLHDDDFAGLDAQIGTGQCGKRSEEAHGSLQTHHRLGHRVNVTAAVKSRSWGANLCSSGEVPPLPIEIVRPCSAIREGLVPKRGWPTTVVPALSPPKRRPMTHRTASIIGGIGRTLIGLGLVVLAFAAFQLWGTGLQEERAQGSLEADFEARQAEIAALTEAAETTPVTTPDAANDAIDDPNDAIDENDNPIIEAADRPPPEVAPELAAALIPDPGESMGSIRIPAIDVERQVIEGVRRDDLRQGPGHYPDTPLPGQAGNAAIAGHRTTYGSPFHNLDLLEPGDAIIVETLQGEFRYEVIEQENPNGGDPLGHFIVNPSQVEILEDFGDNRLTLTACHPKYSARQRIVVTAVLVSEPAPVLPVLEPQIDSAEVAADEPVDELALDEGNVVGIDEDALTESLGWNFEERTPTILWGLATLVILLIGLAAGRMWKRWPAYIATTPFFLASLFVCFTHLDKFLPAL